MIAIEALVLIDGVITLVWQEPISALIAKLHQDSLRGQLARIESTDPSAAERHQLAGLVDERHRIEYLARHLQQTAHDGSAVGRIVIPSIGADFVVVDGTDTSDLEAGPGVYSDA